MFAKTAVNCWLRNILIPLINAALHSWLFKKKSACLQRERAVKFTCVYFARFVRSVTALVTRFVSSGSGWILSPRSWPVWGGSGRNWPQKMRHYGRRHSVATTQLLLCLSLLHLHPLHTLMALPPPPLHLSLPPPLDHRPPPLRSTLTTSWTGRGKGHQGLRNQNQWGTWTWRDKRWVNKR